MDKQDHAALIRFWNICFTVGFGDCFMDDASELYDSPWADRKTWLGTKDFSVQKTWEETKKVKNEVLPQTWTSYPFHLPFCWKRRSAVALKHPLSCWWDHSSRLGTHRAPPLVCDPSTGCRCCHRFLPAVGNISAKKYPWEKHEWTYTHGGLLSSSTALLRDSGGNSGWVLWWGCFPQEGSGLSLGAHQPQKWEQWKNKWSFSRTWPGLPLQYQP